MIPDIFLIRKWVNPFYMQILHGNYSSPRLDDKKRKQFCQDVERALEKITPQLASKLIAGHWRESITGSWFAGLKGFPECQEQIGDLLLASKTCFAGQSHAFAMACYADDVAVGYLVEYLNVYLRKIDCYYDQGWAMPALMWIDQQRDTQHAAPFLQPGGLWDAFVADKISEDCTAWTLESCQEQFWSHMKFCRTHFCPQDGIQPAN